MSLGTLDSMSKFTTPALGLWKPSSVASILDELRRRFSYDPSTGIFTHLTRVGGVTVGSAAGNAHHSGYVFISFHRKLYAAHRLAFLFMTGEWPSDEVDHINGVRDDNRWANLRPATRALNMRNKKRYKNNKSGVKGVTWFPQTSQWRAIINVDDKAHSLGLYDTVEEAATAYAMASKEIHGEFSRLD